MLGIVEDGMRSVIDARKGEEEAMLTGEKVCNIMMTQTRVEEDQQEYEQIEEDKSCCVVHIGLKSTCETGFCPSTWTIIKLVCLILVLLHTGFNVRDRFFAGKTESSTRLTKLEEVEFPVLFNIVVTPGFDFEKLLNLGYEGVPSYVLGLKGFKDYSNYGGWAGNGTNVSETFAAVQSVNSLGDILESIEYYTMGGEDVLYIEDFDEINQKMSYTSTIFKIDLSEKLKGRRLSFLGFTFKKYGDINIEIQLEDKEYSCIRPLMENKMRQKGDKLKLPTEGHRFEYFIDFHQEMFEEDSNTNCQKYPNENYNSFKDCDKSSMRRTLDNLGLKNYTPIWSTDDLTEVTEHMVHNLTSTQQIRALYQMYTGITPSDCKKPCTATTTSSRFMSNFPLTVNSSMVTLLPSEDITINRIELVKLNILTALSFLGGNMGLWLGLGMVQFLEVLFKNDA